jgi:hypothetical protein
MTRALRSPVPFALCAIFVFAYTFTALARDDQALASKALYYPAPSDDRWEKKQPEDVGMDPKALAAAIELAQASDNIREFSLNPREYIEKRTAEEGSGEIFGPFRDRTTINGVVLRHGYIVAEFGDTLKPDMTFSVAKSFVSTTVGLASIIASASTSRMARTTARTTPRSRGTSRCSRPASGKAPSGASRTRRIDGAERIANCRRPARSTNTTTCASTAWRSPRCSSGAVRCPKSSARRS